jgi:hypothetical protein
MNTRSYIFISIQTLRKIPEVIVKYEIVDDNARVHHFNDTINVSPSIPPLQPLNMFDVTTKKMKTQQQRKRNEEEKEIRKQSEKITKDLDELMNRINKMKATSFIGRCKMNRTCTTTYSSIRRKVKKRSTYPTGNHHQECSHRSIRSLSPKRRTTGTTRVVEDMLCSREFHRTTITDRNLGHTILFENNIQSSSSRANNMNHHDEPVPKCSVDVTPKKPMRSIS